MPGDGGVREELEHKTVTTVTNTFPGEMGVESFLKSHPQEVGGKEIKELRHQLSVVKATNFCAQGAP